MNKTIHFFLFFFSIISCHAQFHHQTLTNYTPRDYGQNYSNYTQAITEDAQGLIYVGTAYGILQYDGYKWRMIPVKTGTFVTSLAFFENTVYVGSQGDIGYLKPDKTGKLSYFSLIDKINKNDRNFSSVWKTLVYNNKIVFQSDENIFILDKERIQVIKPHTSFHLAFSINNKLYVRERNIGLSEYNGKEFQVIKGGEQFADTGVFAILPFKNKSLLIATQEAGFFEWNGNNFHQLLKNKEQINTFRNSMIIGGKQLSDNKYAIFSLKDGIFIMDENLEIKAYYSTNTGMRSSEINDLIEDSYHNIWTATKKGISRVQYNSPLSFFNESSGISGNVQAFAFLNNQYFVGTSEGLYFNKTSSAKIFSEATEIKGSIWALQKTNSDLFIGGENGLWHTDGNNIKQINKNQCTGLLYIPEQNWLLSAGNSGVQIFDTKTFLTLLNIPELKMDAYGIASRLTEANKYEIWIGSKTQGVCQLILSPSLTYQLDFYSSEDGLPKDWICAYQAGKNVVFGTSMGILRFIDSNEISSLANDTSSAMNSVRGFFDLANFPKNATNKSATTFTYNNLLSYIALDNYIYQINMNDSVADNSFFKTMQLGRFNVLFNDSNKLWIGGDDGLALFDKNKSIKTKSPQIGIREIIIGNDSVLWYGDIPFSEKEITIPFKLNSLRLELFSLYSDNGFKMEYSYKLEGGNDNFSNWSNDHYITFTNLSEGNYTLHIRAKNPQDIYCKEISFNFTITPPWYRSWWAYTIYVILIIFAIYIIILLNSQRLKAKNRKLEEIVKIRTQEVVAQRDEIEEQKQEITDSINYAKRIQEAVLPVSDQARSILGEHFILFKPKDIVSGDFFWATRMDEWLIVTVSDCTGHGVPGAFMSMLGVSFLNEIVRKKEIIKASEVLDLLRESIIEALQQKGHSGEQKDGMDIVFCVLNTQTNLLQYAGANNPLFVVTTNKELKIIEPNKQPVAIFANMNSFTNREIQLNKGDCIYLASDGYEDQFGGPKNRKFMVKQLKELLVHISDKTMVEQYEILNQTFENWKGENEQIDDVTLMGIRI